LSGGGPDPSSRLDEDGVARLKLKSMIIGDLAGVLGVEDIVDGHELFSVCSDFT
jgi:hypothetical protein